MVVWFYSGSWQVYGDRKIKEASEQTKEFEKAGEKHKSRQKAVDNMLK